MPRASGEPAITTMRKIGIVPDLVRFRRVSGSSVDELRRCANHMARRCYTLAEMHEHDRTTRQTVAEILRS